MHSSLSAFALFLCAFFLSLLSCVHPAFGTAIPVVAREASEAREVPVDGTPQNLTLRDDGTGVHQLERRFSNARFTFYDAGLGACGRVNTNSDFIVALNAAQWAGGAHCFETVTISYGGKTTRATVMDLCPGCPFGGLDLTRGLFGFFANHDLGVIQGSWDFGGSAPQPQPQPRPTTTTRRSTPTPTTTRRTTTTRPPPAPTPPRTTTRTTPRTTTTPRAAPPPSPTTTRPAPSPTTIRTPPAVAPTTTSASNADRIAPNVLNDLNRVFVALGALVADILEAQRNQQ